MTAFRVYALVLCLALPAQPAAAAGPRAPETEARTNVLTPTGPGLVTGTVWNHDGRPLAFPLVRLRNLTTGRILTGVQGDPDGRFVFERVSPGSYVVELVDNSGAVLAVGHLFSCRAGERVATFIRLTARPGWFDGFFSNAAAAALTAAASLGVTAVGSGSQPASARQ